MIPTISIIIPLYNKAAYIAQTIESVQQQTFTNWEMLVIDNGSTDGGDEKVTLIEDSRIKLLVSPKRGPGSARNYGLNYAQGKWILFLDADDLLTLDYFALQLDCAKLNPGAEIIAGFWQEFTDDKPNELVLKPPVGINQPISVLRDGAIAFPPWAVHAAIIKRDAILLEYYWPENLDQYLGEDIAFWFKLVYNCSVAYSNSQGALYRIQTPQCRTQLLNPVKWYEGIHNAITHNIEYLAKLNQSCTPNQCSNLMRVYGSIYLLGKGIDDQPFKEAKKWLECYFQQSDSPSLGMRVRKYLGLKLFWTLFKKP